MDNNYKKLFLIQISASLAETITYPIDYVKTLIQINNKNTSFTEIIWNISTNKNKLQIYNGLKPALLRHSLYSTFRINMYENLRNHMKSKDNTIHLSTKLLIGGLSGGISQLITSPCDLLKIRYITNLKTQQNISLYCTTKQIYKENGLRGLWKGVTPNVSRAVLVNVGELATYDHAKQYIKNKFKLEENIYLHILSSSCSGFVSSLCCTPADVIKSRMMQVNSPYHSISNCIGKTIYEEGVLSLYKGFFPIWFRLAPWQLVFWVSYEKLRIQSGLESF